MRTNQIRQYHFSMNRTPSGGKTYTLAFDGISSNEYYRHIKAVTDSLLPSFGSAESFLSFLRAASDAERGFLRFFRRTIIYPILLNTLKVELSVYTPNVSEHLRSLAIRERFSGALAMTELQYHLAMVEIELVNRINAAAFMQSERKIALLPHCLRDLDSTCRAELHGFDYVCKNCSKQCTINSVSRIFRRHNIEPYLWMSANLNAAFKAEKIAGRAIGVFGVACIPELVNGMRRCGKADIPVIGVPLDANRCARWWGEFYPNSVNLTEVKKLLQ